MRSPVKFFLINFSSILIVGVLLFAGGCLSRPRDFSSPRTTIKIIDASGAPVSDVEVGRNWYDSDCNKDDSETIKTDQNGTAQFSKVPAKVGLFTGALRKTLTSFGPCGSRSGTWTKIYVRFAGHYKVAPKDKPLHPTGLTYQDPDGVTFYVSFDSNSNTMANLSFPTKAKMIDYVLVSKRSL